MTTRIRSGQRTMILSVVLFFMAWTSSAQSDAYKKAIEEIEAQFGGIPTMFKIYPEYGLASAWDNWKTMMNQSPLPAKYRELLQLAVASQIPCQYCVYFHTLMAQSAGATEEEIKDAIAQGAQTRHWSMILQGNQVSFDAFKTELDNAMKSMAAKAEEKK